jgi:hypothetical protein
MNAPLPRAATEAADSYADAVDARTTALMSPGAEFYPLTGVNLAEALVAADPAFFDKLGAALACRDSRNTTGCDLMRAEAEAYWKKPAERQAVIEVDAECRDALTASLEARAEAVIWHRGMGAQDSPGMA